jgi:CheY-like chemotaxis protein
MATPSPESYLPKVRPTVLVVDDEETVRTFLVETLELLGCSARGLASGQEAVFAVKDKCPDLVLLDILLPGMDGVETMRELHEAQPGIAVIMISAPENTPLAQHALNFGARDFLTKPIGLNDLKQVLKIHLKFPK